MQRIKFKFVIVFLSIIYMRISGIVTKRRVLSLSCPSHVVFFPCRFHTLSRSFLVAFLPCRVPLVVFSCLVAFPIVMLLRRCVPALFMLCQVSPCRVPALSCPPCRVLALSHSPLSCSSIVTFLPFCVPLVLFPPCRVPPCRVPALLRPSLVVSLHCRVPPLSCSSLSCGNATLSGVPVVCLVYSHTCCNR